MRETITAALKHATKAQDKRRMSTLRLVSAAIKDRDIAARTAGKGEATDAELLDLFAKMIKQREESEKIYADAGRAELAKEGEEIAIIREFLPVQLSEADVHKAVADAIAQAGAASVKDMGKVIAALKASYAGQMDFTKASALVKQKRRPIAPSFRRKPESSARSQVKIWIPAFAGMTDSWFWPWRNRRVPRSEIPIDSSDLARGHLSCTAT